EFFLDFDNETSALQGFVKGFVGVAGAVIVNEIIHDIGGRVPKSLEPDLAKCLAKFVQVYPEETRGWALACLQQEGWPSPHVSVADKTAFVQALMSKRTLKIKEGAKAFGLKCRKLDGTAYAYAV
ncbi:hypothetical protein HK097_002462, partial [Rhizophlyctis rosea]